ncbi:MAG: serine/threonine protein phosphatase [Clostridiaceae bacterium]
MFSDKRLTEAYNNARVEYFDEKSRYIFFSDTHRGDRSLSDEFTGNVNIYIYALEYYFNNDYVYVEAGDGDELWEHSSFKHIRFAHSDVFDIMKKFYDNNRLIMLYGNHNMYLKNKHYVTSHLYRFFDEYNEEYIELFNGIDPCEALVLKNKNTGQEILTVHGHQGDFMNDQLWYLTMLTLRYFWRFIHIVGFQNPASPAKNFHKMHKIEKMYNKWIEKNMMMLICGHTHRPKFPKSHELPYFNTGCGIRAGWITGIEISEGKIMLVDWRVMPNKDGVLQIERKIAFGPELIENFDLKNHGFCRLNTAGRKYSQAAQ